MSRIININIERLLFGLLCLYAFFIPLEKVLEVLFDIDTQLKPYRILALLIFVVFGIRASSKWSINTEFKQDIFLYLMFSYGLILTLFRMASTPFNLSFFYNDIFQIGLYVGVFVVMRHMDLTRMKIDKILNALTLGIIINAFYVFYKFHILQGFSRTGGFIDNPNFMAMSIVVGMNVLLIQRSKIKKRYQKIIGVLLLLFLAYVLYLAASRTGIALFAISIVVMFLFFSWKEKFRLIGLVIVALIGIQLGGAELIKKSGPALIQARFNKKTTEDPRLVIWEGILRASNETNFVGLGIGQFKGRFHEFYYDESDEKVKNMIQRKYYFSPHSDYFASLIIYGIIGLLLYLVFIFMSGLKILLKLRLAKAQIDKMHYQKCSLLFLSIVLFGITSENFGHALFWMLMGICTKLDFPKEKNSAGNVT